MDFKKQKPYYPDLVRIFYTNMTVNQDMIITTVKGEFTTITPVLISVIFGLQNSGRTLDQVKMIDNDTLELMFTDGKCQMGKYF